MENEVKKAISELEKTSEVSNEDIFLISRPYSSGSKYNSYRINVGDFLSTALSDYYDVKSFVEDLAANAYNSAYDYTNLHFVFKLSSINESIDGKKTFIVVPLCSSDPIADDDLVNKKYFENKSSSYISSALSNYSLKDHEHDDRYSSKDHKHNEYSLSDHVHSQYILKTSIANELGDSKEKVASQWLLSASLSNYLIIGDNGDVVYATPSGMLKLQICNKILVCSSADEVKKCKDDSASHEFDIADLQNDEVLRYDSSTSSWKKISEKHCIEHIGYGRIAYNQITKRLFFNDGASIYDIGTLTDVSPIYNTIRSQLDFLNEVV